LSGPAWKRDGVEERRCARGRSVGQFYCSGRSGWNVKVASPGRLVAWSPWEPRRLVVPSGLPAFGLVHLRAGWHPSLHCVAGSSPAEPGSSKTARGGEVRDRFSPSAHLPSRAQGPNKRPLRSIYFVYACVRLWAQSISRNC